MQVFTDLVVDKLFSFTMAKLMMYTPYFIETRVIRVVFQP